MFETKNLFNEIIGSFLKQERSKIQESTKFFCKSLDVGHSLYRMIEAGNACVLPNKVFDVIRVLKDVKISIEKLSKFLIGAQLIDKSMQGGLDSIDALIDLRKYNDLDFNEIISSILEIENLKDSGDKKVFIETIGVDELKIFLNDGYEQDNKENPTVSMAISNLDTTPSLSYEMIDSLIKWSKRHPPTHISGIAENWESDNAQYFSELHSVYLDEDIVISKENLERFDFSYLEMKSFRFCKMLFVSDNSAENLTDRFCAILDKCRLGKGDNKLTPQEKKKIIIRTIKKQDKNVKRLFLGEGSFINRELQACWVFTTVNDYHIGFTGCEKKHQELVINLSVGESYKRYQELSKLF